MKQTLQILLQLRDEGALTKFAVGGAVAASFYIEAVSTEDLDIFAFLRRSVGGLVILTPLYDRLRQLGAAVQDEHVVIHGWPVQILPAYTPLVEAAVNQAEEQDYAGLKVPVVTADYLCAIALQTRPPQGLSACVFHARCRLHHACEPPTIDPDARSAGELEELCPSIRLIRRFLSSMSRAPKPHGENMRAR